MKLKDFIEEFIEPNTLIRLLYKERGGHLTVSEDGWDIVSMEWEVLRGEGAFKNYADNEVIGITDIITESCPEAVNITIKP